MAAQPGESVKNLLDVTETEVRQTLGRILASKYFSHAPKKKRFLTVVCEAYLNGRAGELNEYLIGREVFDRDNSYSPAADPIVRVGAHDVRKKLELYYQNEGADDEIRLEIPVGSYEPVFVRQPPEPVVGPAEEITEPSFPSSPSVPPADPAGPAGAPARPASRRGQLLVAAVVTLAAVACALALWNYRLQQKVEGAAPRYPKEYGSVWEPFLQDGDPTLFIISNPPVYRFLNGADPEATASRSVGLTPEQGQQVADSLGDKFIMKYNPSPRLVLSPEDYTGMGEAIGLYRLTDLFRAAGRSTTLKQSRNVSAEDLKHQNVILLGSVWSNEWSGKPIIQEDFTYTGRATIENTAPLPGEEREYKPVFDPRNGSLLADYALITVKPNISEKNTVMVLAGVHSEGTQAAAEYVTSKEYLNELNNRLRAAGQEGPPRYYQALLKIGVDNGIPTTIALLTIHELSLRRN